MCDTITKNITKNVIKKIIVNNNDFDKANSLFTFLRQNNMRIFREYIFRFNNILVFAIRYTLNLVFQFTFQYILYSIFFIKVYSICEEYEDYKLKINICTHKRCMR